MDLKWAKIFLFDGLKKHARAIGGTRSSGVRVTLDDTIDP